MCSRYTVKRDEEKIRLRDKIVIYGALPREDIRPTDLAPILIPDDDDFQMTQMRWGWRVPWDKSPLINAKSETLLTLKTYAAHLQNRCLIAGRRARARRSPSRSGLHTPKDPLPSAKCRSVRQ